MSHTKDEWQIVFFKGISEQEMYVKVSGGSCICKILDRPSAEKKANARLIAAAPDLLEALKQISDIEDERYTHAGFDLEVNNIAKVAIAKAKKEG